MGDRRADEGLWGERPASVCPARRRGSPPGARHPCAREYTGSPEPGFGPCPYDELVQSSMLDIDGPIYVADFGGDGPVMLLVHGLGGAHLNWMAVAPQLAAHHRVYALDLPGFGRSPLAGRRSTIAANVDLLTRAITRLSRGPIVLMGNSMGGLLAIGAAARHPSLVDALVLVDPAVPAPGAGFPPPRAPGSRALFSTASL